MPYKDKSKKGKWRAQVERNGHRRTKLFATKAEASQWEADQERLPLQEFLNETHTGYSLAEWSEKYLNHAKGMSYSAYMEKRLAFKRMFGADLKKGEENKNSSGVDQKKPPIDPALPVDKLHAGEVLEHFDKVAEKQTGNVANKDRKNLIAAWNWAIKYMPGFPKDNPFAITDRQEAQEAPRYVPPVEDFWKVFDAMDGQDRVMMLTYLHTAARRRELFILKWEDVDFTAGKIRLWTRKRKGKLECDWVTMTKELSEALQGWKMETPFKGKEHVFLCENDLEFCKEEHYGHPFKHRREWPQRVCRRLGLKTFGLHAVRHLSASILDDLGYPITVIQTLLRHKSANTTAKYLHKLRGMKEVLDDAFKRRDRPTEDVAPSLSERPKLRLVKR